MIFYIQASNPVPRKDASLDEDTLGGAIEESFDLWTENAILNWNGVRVPVCYKYDMPYMLEDLFEMLEAILDSQEGKHVVKWPSDTFRAKWTLMWNAEELSCRAEWDRIGGNVEAILNSDPVVKLPTEEFLAEWKAPLERVVDGLEAVGYRADSLSGLSRLEALIERIKGRGLLYGGAATARQLSGP